MPAPRFHPFVRLVICSIGLVVAAMAMSGVILAAVYVAAHLEHRTPSADATQTFLTQNALLLTLLIYPALLLWLWFCRRVFDRRSFVSLGLRKRHSVRDATLGICSGACAVTLLFLILWLGGHAATPQFSSAAQSLPTAKIIQLLALWAAAFAIVGFMEEVIFRGYLLHNFSAWLGATGATIVQAILFALIHLGNISQGAAPPDALRAMPNLMLIGVFFALCYQKTGSLWFPIGFHAAWNFCLGCVFSLPVSGIQTFRLFDVQISPATWATGGSFGAEGSVLLLPVIGLMIYLMAREREHPQAALDLNLLRSNSMEIEAPPEEQDDAPRYRTTFRGSLRVIRNEETEIAWGNDLKSPQNPSRATLANPILVQNLPNTTQNSLTLDVQASTPSKHSSGHDEHTRTTSKHARTHDEHTPAHGVQAHPHSEHERTHDVQANLHDVQARTHDEHAARHDEQDVTPTQNDLPTVETPPTTPEIPLTPRKNAPKW